MAIPLVGARTPAQLGDNLACLETKLTDEDLAALDAVSAIDLGFPYTTIETNLIRNLRAGGGYGVLDNHRA